jgi:hypothetical protein
MITNSGYKSIYLKMLKPIFYLLFISVVLCSCGDCVQHAEGIILDKKTKKPIDSVYVHKIGQQTDYYSDSTGHFEIRATSGGIFSCPILQVAFYKNGYATIAEDTKPPDTVYMTKDN